MKKEIILFHGWGGSRKSLTPLAMQLEQLGFATFVTEMPAHGESSEMKIAWDMELFAQWAKEQITASNFSSPILLGHSFGGKILLELCTNGSINNDIILINSSGIKPDLGVLKKSIKKMSGLTASFKGNPVFETVRKSLYKYVLREKDYLEASGKLKESFKKIIETHYDTDLENINNNVLIIWGKNDKDTPLWMGKLLHERIQKSTIVVLEGTHGLPLHSPDKVAKIIRNHY